MDIGKRKIRILWISNYNIEVGRGPMNRLYNMMDSMSQLCDLHLYSLGPVDDIIAEKASKLSIPYTSSECIFSDWNVINAKELAHRIKSYSDKNNMDLVVLTWELWDLAIALFHEYKRMPYKLLIVTHSIPFAGMQEKERTFLIDVLKRTIQENHTSIKKYIMKNFTEAIKYIPKLQFLTMTPTVEKRLKYYFPNVCLYSSYPGYAIQSHCIQQQHYVYHMAFMARFEKGKGIYEILHIVRSIKKNKPDVRIVMIGSFTYPQEEKRYKKLISKYGLEKNIVFTGWLDGTEKYRVLNSAKIFIYPSFCGDTFSISMLEALNIGKKVVCYDVPFTRDNYISVPDITFIPPHNIKLFASECIKLIDHPPYYSQKNVCFTTNHFSSWTDVSKSEFKCYRQLLKKAYRHGDLNEINTDS